MRAYREVYPLRPKLILRKRNGQFSRSIWAWLQTELPLNRRLVYVWAIIVLVFLVTYVDSHNLNPFKVEEVQAVTVVEPVREVKLLVVIDWTPERVEKEIRETFPEAPNTAVAIAKAESGAKLKIDAYNPEAHKGCNGSYGVFQIACVHHRASEDLFDPAVNIKKARKIYLKEGWKPWGAYTSGGYKKYL